MDGEHYLFTCVPLAASLVAGDRLPDDDVAILVHAVAGLLVGPGRLGLSRLDRRTEVDATILVSTCAHFERSPLA
jgi:hypothetical protein